MKIYVGNDASKGYGDIVFLNEAETLLPEGRRFDDTAEGHKQLRVAMLGLKAKNEDVEFVVGLEASGGFERNWLKFFKNLKSEFKIELFLLNAFAVRKFFERNLRRNKTDRISARNIAEYLKSGLRRKDFEWEPQMQGARTLYGCINAAIGRRVQIQNQLQSLLPTAQPELVQYCRDGIPGWVIELLLNYPTAEKLSKAKAKTVCKINSITESRATKLIQAAKESVASLMDEQSALSISFLASEIKEQNQKIEKLQKSLEKALKDDPAVKIIDGIKGIGIWTAMVLRLEYGNIERFYSADAAVAYAGLDPRLDQSGDQLHNLSISRAGRIRIRAALYMPALAAIRFNPIIRNFYNHLIAEKKPEKVAVVACMRKLIHIVYACWISGKPFDPNYQVRKQNQPVNKTETMQPLANVVASLSAPISRKEAKRRKAAAMPQKRDTFMRGPGAASNNDNRKFSD
ncbi:IS110 family transposase [bacterium]|nr:IS110 family transposase [bacterium]MCI0614055.1 IS110 family transposase [bacterium]